MATSGSFNCGGGYQGRTLQFAWSRTGYVSDSSNCYSDIYWELRVVGGSSSYYYHYHEELYINGGCVYNNGSRTKRYTGTIGSGTYRIYHDGAGNASFSAQIREAIYTSAYNGDQTTWFALDTLPRQANITSCGDFNSDQNPSFTFSNPGGFDMECWLEPNPGGTHYAIRTVPNTASGTYTWTLTDEERNQLRNACKGKTCVCRVGLYSNNRTWASYQDKTYTIVNAEPSFTSVTSAAVNPFGSLYLQGKSSAKLTINGASGKYGATIVKYEISGDAITYSGTVNNATTGILNTSGTRTYTATITDSRGFTASKTCTINVTAYTLPTLTMECYRATSGSVRDDAGGTYILVKPTFSCCAITGNSITTKSLVIAGTTKSTTFSSGVNVLYGTYAVNSTYLVSVSVKDTVGNTVTIQQTIGIGTVPFNINKEKNGVGLLTYATNQNYITLGKPMMYGGVAQMLVTKVETW